MQTSGNNISLYFHIPFCKKKCPYCDFYSIYYTKSLTKRFVKALISETKQKLSNKILFDKKDKVISIFFGGGTPSLLEIDQIYQILDIIKNKDKNCETTIEANVEDLSIEYIEQLKSLKINRISLGVESFDDKALKILNRKHNKKKAIEIINLLSKNFKNISINLLYDIPKISLKSFEKSIKIASFLPIDHISLYNLTFEKTTPFYKIKENLKKELPKEKDFLRSLKKAKILLKEKGFQQYEISAFSKKNKRSIHNMGYWTGREFLGFGPSAYSYKNKKRFKNISNLFCYLKLVEKNKDPKDFEENLIPSNNLKEALTLNLRLLEGINIEKFQKKHGFFPKKTKDSLKKLQKEGFLKKDKNLKLSEKGILFYDLVAEEII